MNKFYITTPIYYVNDIPHIGSAYTTIAADVLTRWHRQIGDKTFFLTGTDEHGAKIEAKAKEAGKSPQEFVDNIATQFQSAWQNLHIGYDRFIRTTESEHIKAAQNALQLMYDKGDIYAGKYEGSYCRGCEQFKSERDLVNGKCPDHDTAPEVMSEKCHMFKLSKYKEEILAMIKNDEYRILPAERKNEVVSFYEKEGLNDIAFSRQNVKWGIPLPWDNSQTAYVWADAFLNYLTGLNWLGPNQPLHPSAKGDALSFFESGATPREAGCVTDAEQLTKRPALTPPWEGITFWPPDVQLMSKDILRVHTTIWPAMLLSLGLPLPKQIFVHGYFMVEGKKMSKSLSNVIRPEEMIKKYGVDATRYLLMSTTPFGNDSDVSWAKFDEKYNADLANGLGNLVARVTNLIEKNKLELDLKKEAGGFGDHYESLMNELKLEQALKYIWDNFRSLDMELAEKKPWKEDDIEKIKNILEPVAQKILSLVILVQPFMPEITEKIIVQLTVVEIKKGKALFPRIS